MRIASIHHVEPHALPGSLPVHLVQKSSTGASLLKLLVLVPLMIALLVPFAVLAEAVFSDSALRGQIASKPATLLLLGLALGAWCLMLAWPVKRLIAGLARSRTIEIVPGLVAITDRGLFGARRRLVRLDSYSGVIHHVRASLSGLRHELILAHPDRKSSILLAISDRITQGEIARASDLLGHREVPSGTIYRLARPRLVARTQAAIPKAA